jgi:DNA-binding MarR family transcriptional regulator
MDMTNDSTHELSLLDRIENDPDVTQADLATQLGVAVGTVNWHLKRLISKGYVKVMHAERRKLRYIITPEGLAKRARLTVDYIEQQFLLYRRIRNKVKDVLTALKQDGHDSIRIEGEGDVADICRLTCIEQGVHIVTDGKVPVLEVKNLSVSLRMDDKVDG